MLATTRPQDLTLEAPKIFKLDKDKHAERNYIYPFKGHRNYMIHNEKQYRATLRQQKLLVEALDKLILHRERLSAAYDERDNDLYVLELQHASISGQLADLNAEISEYELLRKNRAPQTDFRQTE